MAACKDLCEFLTIEFSDEMLDGKNYKDIFGKKFDPKTHTSFPDEDRKPINRWKKKLSNDEIGLTEALVGSQMTHFGYELSTNINNNSLVWIVDILNPLYEIYRCDLSWPLAPHDLLTEVLAHSNLNEVTQHTLSIVCLVNNEKVTRRDLA